MNTCKTCKHWTAPGTAPMSHLGDRVCHPKDPDTFEAMLLPYEVRICRQPTQGFCETPAESNGFSLADASDYYAVLATAQDFGCVRHEPLETEPR